MVGTSASKIGIGLGVALVAAAQVGAQTTQPANGAAVVPADQPTAADAVAQPTSPPMPPPGVSTKAPAPYGYAGRDWAHDGRPVPEDFLAIPDRWRIGLPPGYLEEVRKSTGELLNPYQQNALKGDYPVFGQDKFLVVTLVSDTLYEARRLPVPSGASALEANRLDFFGQGDQQIASQNFVLSIELFKGDAAFKPRDWELRLTQVYNINYAHVEELGGTNADVREGRHRLDDAYAWQEAFVEKHMGDTSNAYDFFALRAGIQGFNADFRGFLYADSNFGVRLFGNFDNNQYQWNLAWFHQLEKDTNSGLNTFTFRDQDVFLANVYKQDFLGLLGYTAQLSLAANIDNGDIQFDENDVLVRPQPVGTIGTKDVRAYYLGWAGDGRIGRFNLTHQFYQVFGVEDENALAGQETRINAQFFAAEVSYDDDWRRYRASFAYASGDGDPEDDQATGFDGIFDNPNFAGGGFNFFTRQAIRLTGSGVNLVNRNSFYTDLRTSKEQGQANFVNPGLLMYNVGFDADITPRLKWINNATYLQFADPEVLRLVLNDNGIDRDIGLDLSTGIIYRPFHNNNVILNAGISVLIPAEGFKEIYSSETLYSGFVSLTLTY